MLALSSPPRSAAVTALCGYLLGGLSAVPANLPVLPPAVLVLSLIAPAVVFAFVVALFRYAVLRFDHWSAALVFPILWTAWEHIASRWGTYGSLAYSQTDFVPVIQIASIAGLAGITFVVMLTPAGLAVAWHFRRRRRHMVAALTMSLGVWLVVVAWGAARLTGAAVGPTVRVGLASTDTTVRFFRTERADEALGVVAAYAERVGQLAQRGARIVVLPEKLVGVTPAYAGTVRQTLAEPARRHGLLLVAGVNQIERPAKRNTAIVFSANGEIETEYDKIHLIPGLEAGYRAGAAPGLIRTAERPWGVAICRDMDFPELGRTYARAGVGLMLVPAWDFVRDARIHSRMALMRGVEGGYAVARSAQQGFLTVSDHHGRILAEAASWAAPDVLLVADVTPGPGATFYARTGHWLATLNTVAAVATLVAFCLAYTAGRNERRSRGESGPATA